MSSTIRSQEKEQLDNLSLGGSTLHKTLNSLKLINTYLGNHSQLGNTVIDYCTAHPKNTPFIIVDIGCGGGDSIFHIAKKLHKKGILANCIGIDGNAESIAYAQKQHTGDTNKFITADILDAKFSIPKCDILISSHFIYHFKDQELTAFLNKISLTAVQHIIFSELYRSKTAYTLFKLSHILLPISKVAKKDGLLAIQRAFTLTELKAIIQASSIEKFKIIKKPFFRTIAKLYP